MVRIRNRVVPLIVILATGLAGCGGDKVAGGKPEEGSPAATGKAPDCSVVPVELAEKALKLDLDPAFQTLRPNNGTSCVFRRPNAGGAAQETVLFNGSENKESFAIIRDGYEKNNIKVNKIGGWGDEAYAVKVKLFVDTNTFAVRKGQVSVTITSVADFPEIRDLMKPILEKITEAPA